MGMASQRRFISVNESYRLLGISRSTFRKVRQSGDFPCPIPVASRRIVFDRREVMAWCRQRQATRDVSMLLSEDEAK